MKPSKKSILLFSAVLFLMAFQGFHPIHIAITEVKYDEKAQTLQFTHKLFTDDLEKQLEAEAKKAGKNTTFHLNSAKENPKSDESLKNYLTEYFSVSIDGKAYKPKFIGKEYETDATWLFAEIENIKAPKLVEITDVFLLNLYYDQVNFVHINVNTQKKTLRFRNSETKQTWQLE
jgi:hypothetical protein